MVGGGEAHSRGLTNQVSVDVMECFPLVMEFAGCPYFTHAPCEQNDEMDTGNRKLFLFSMPAKREVPEHEHVPCKFYRS